MRTLEKKTQNSKEPIINFFELENKYKKLKVINTNSKNEVQTRFSNMHIS